MSIKEKIIKYFWEKGTPYTLGDNPKIVNFYVNSFKKYIHPNTVFDTFEEAMSHKKKQGKDFNIYAGFKSGTGKLLTWYVPLPEDLLCKLLEQEEATPYRKGNL